MRRWPPYALPLALVAGVGALVLLARNPAGAAPSSPGVLPPAPRPPDTAASLLQQGAALIQQATANPGSVTPSALNDLAARLRTSAPTDPNAQALATTLDLLAARSRVGVHPTLPTAPLPVGTPAPADPGAAAKAQAQAAIAAGTTALNAVPGTAAVPPPDAVDQAILALQQAATTSPNDPAIPALIQQAIGVSNRLHAVLDALPANPGSLPGPQAVALAAPVPLPLGRTIAQVLANTGVTSSLARTTLAHLQAQFATQFPGVESALQTRIAALQAVGL